MWPKSWRLMWEVHRQNWEFGTENHDTWPKKGMTINIFMRLGLNMAGTGNFDISNLSSSAGFDS